MFMVGKSPGTERCSRGESTIARVTQGWWDGKAEAAASSKTLEQEGGKYFGENSTVRRNAKKKYRRRQDREVTKRRNAECRMQKKLGK